MKKFEIPSNYKSSFVSEIKELRKNLDKRKRDYSPTELDFGRISVFLARHFGFCYGVENAIEIAYKTIEENKGKQIYLLSEMIHNPDVNKDLMANGVEFLMDTKGNQIIPWSRLTSDDIVIIPAFGTTIEIEKKLNEIGIDPYKYNTTCPFVEKVWNRAEILGRKEATVIIHGKFKHEETIATFSHSIQNAPSIIVRDINEAEILGKIILGELGKKEFDKYFKDKVSINFKFERDLDKIGVVNQTTMLASETAEIADFLKSIMIKKHGEETIKDHFIDTRDTLCYATNDNQNATYDLMKLDADFAIVVGGYNSSNTTHLVELLEDKFPTYFINGDSEILSDDKIRHFDIHKKEIVETSNFLPKKEKVKTIITSGASCPDALVEKVIRKIASFDSNSKDLELVMDDVRERHS